MSAVKHIYVLTTIMLLFSSNLYAANDAGMKKFYSDAKNRQALENAKSKGLLKKSRSQIFNSCTKQQNSKQNCKCMEREVNKLPDDEFFYESIMIYLEFQEKIKAIKENNKELLAKLQKQHSKRASLAKHLEKVCTK